MGKVWHRAPMASAALQAAEAMVPRIRRTGVSHDPWTEVLDCRYILCKLGRSAATAVPGRARWRLFCHSSTKAVFAEVGWFRSVGPFHRPRAAWPRLVVCGTGAICGRELFVPDRGYRRWPGSQPSRRGMTNDGRRASLSEGAASGPGHARWGRRCLSGLSSAPAFVWQGTLLVLTRAAEGKRFAAPIEAPVCGPRLPGVLA